MVPPTGAEGGALPGDPLDPVGGDAGGGEEDLGSEGAMTTHTEITICNTALSLMGTSLGLASPDGTLASSTTNDESKLQCDLHYPQERDRLLSGFSWSFAKVWAQLTLVTAGTGQTWEGEWANAYAYPTDCARASRFKFDTGRWIEHPGWAVPEGYGRWSGTTRWAYRFIVAHHSGAKVILANLAEEDAILVYTKRLTDPALYSDHFAHALSCALAAKLARVLPGNKNTAELEQMALIARRDAMAFSGNEHNDQRRPDFSFVTEGFY